jgi:hypothetical protein
LVAAAPSSLSKRAADPKDVAKSEEFLITILFDGPSSHGKASKGSTSQYAMVMKT